MPAPDLGGGRGVGGVGLPPPTLSSNKSPSHKALRRLKYLKTFPAVCIRWYVSGDLEGHFEFCHDAGGVLKMPATPEPSMAFKQALPAPLLLGPHSNQASEGDFSMDFYKDVVCTFLCGSLKK